MHRPPLTARLSHAARTTLAAAAVLTALAACQSAPTGAGTGDTETPQSVPAAEIATATGDEVDVFAEKAGAKADSTLGSPNELGADRTFLVERNDGDWLKVLLPVRPNGSTGWVKADQVKLSTTTLRVEIDPDAFTFAVHDGAKEIRSGKIGTGTGKTPTPPGRYFLTELLEPPDPGGDYGAYAFGLSGFSETLETFAGGPGQLAVHGTNDNGDLGREVSHGCIRVSDKDITWMAEKLPLGTPVEIAG
ncbi:lipoprotein-anchoring transpeptidase ErfK/SrfK [Murinocardiopsis flavida]|uniref:Lipoprotein-anchoring transpeptidase ErfK/SrfK n=1 Tax=Murinocardiopsis flavida TaxID=645275 RepID=A0A2P8DRN8_9ACTN|nr:lipoprotein-anchoring transpeptidase ErfK/SrfK [Murinocardiopsis flavida]